MLQTLQSINGLNSCVCLSWMQLPLQLLLSGESNVLNTCLHYTVVLRWIGLLCNLCRNLLRMCADVFAVIWYACTVNTAVFVVLLQCIKLSKQPIPTLLRVEMTCHYRSVYITNIGHHREKLCVCAANFCIN